jgi:Glyoxalase/Bleomycin resistance protein/Dioxygenase superfamily
MRRRASAALMGFGLKALQDAAPTASGEAVGHSPCTSRTMTRRHAGFRSASGRLHRTTWRRDDPEPQIGHFLRLSLGDALVDHHCLLVLHTPRPGVHHISFELDDLDAIMSLHSYLLNRGYTLDFGVGRHLMGSSIFDCRRDSVRLLGQALFKR